MVCRVANKSATSWQEVVVMEFGKPHDTRHTTETTDFCPRQLVTDLLQICYDEATGKLMQWILALNTFCVCLWRQPVVYGS